VFAGEKSSAADHCNIVHEHIVIQRLLMMKEGLRCYSCKSFAASAAYE
jgi:hypothetical protein